MNTKRYYHLLAGTALGLLLCNSSSSAQAASMRDVFDDLRILEPDLLRARFSAGETQLPVIVNLAVPPQLRAFRDWQDVEPDWDYSVSDSHNFEDQ